MEINCKSKKDLIDRDAGFVLDDFGNYLSIRDKIRCTGLDAIYIYMIRVFGMTSGMVKALSFTEMYDMLGSEIVSEMGSGRWQVSEETNQKRSSLVVKCRKRKRV